MRENGESYGKKYDGEKCSEFGRDGKICLTGITALYLGTLFLDNTVQRTFITCSNENPGTYGVNYGREKSIDFGQGGKISFSKVTYVFI